MIEQHTKEPCIAESVTDDFTEGTWLFEPVGNFRVGAGRYALMPERDYLELKRQRDALLVICEELAESAAYWSEYDVPLGIVDRLNAAIAKAKEGEKLAQKHSLSAN